MCIGDLTLISHPLSVLNAHRRNQNICPPVLDSRRQKATAGQKAGPLPVHRRLNMVIYNNMKLRGGWFLCAALLKWRRKPYRTSAQPQLCFYTIMRTFSLCREQYATKYATIHFCARGLLMHAVSKYIHNEKHKMSKQLNRIWLRHNWPIKDTLTFKKNLNKERDRFPVLFKRTTSHSIKCVLLTFTYTTGFKRELCWWPIFV